MRRLLLFFVLLSPLGAVCTISVTNPAGSSTVTGVTTITPSLSSCPSLNAGGTIAYILNDFYVIATVKNAPTFTYTWSSAFVLDGPAQIKAVGYDSTGAVVATSAEVAFSVLNYGATCTVNSPASFQSTPTISGTLTIDFTCSGITLANIQFSMDGIPWFFGYSSGTYPTGGSAQHFDTTTLLNGNHLVSVEGIRTASPNALPAFQIQFLINVSNTAANIVAVKPDITDVVLTVGGPTCTSTSVASGGCGAYTLAPVMVKADGSTASSTFTFSHLDACNLAAADNPDNIDFPCTSGNAFAPLPGFATGAGTSFGSWVSLSATSAATTTITALARGHSVIKIVDNSTSKVTYIQVAVKSYTAPPHFANDGTIRTSYGNDGKDIFRSSLFNLGLIAGGSGYDAGWPSSLIQSKFSALELGYSLNGYGFANLAAWQSAWVAGQYAQVAANLNVLPGFCLDGTGDGAAFSPTGGLNDTASGPSASWSPPPLTQSLNYLNSHGYHVCGTEAHDEIDGIWLFNPEYSLSVADGTLSNVVVTGCPTCLATWTTAKATGINSQYGGKARANTGKVLVQGATSTGLNGLHTVQTNGYWCGQLDLWLRGDCGGSIGPNSGPVFTFKTNCVGCANGTYTDAGMNILGWGDTTPYPVFAGENPTQNNAFTIAHSQMVAAGAADAYPPRALAGQTPVANWSRKGAYTVRYIGLSGIPAIAEAQYPTFFWGNSFREYYATVFTRTWGNVNGAGTGYCPYWQCSQTGYVTWKQDAPAIIQEGINTWNFNIGGRSVVPVMSGSCMTATPYDGIPYQTNGPMEWHRLAFSGNSDSNMNTFHSGHWFAGLPCNNGLGHEIFATSGNITGCTVNPSGGTATIRGVAFSITAAQNIGTSGGSFDKSTNFTLSPTPPQDLAYGEPIPIAGQPSACNVRAAFYGYSGANTITTTNFANSTGTGGTVLINDDGGYPNPTFDVLNFNTRFNGVEPDAAYANGLGYAGIKSYDANTQSIQLANIGNSFPCSPACTPGLSPNEDPFPNSNIDIQRRWQSTAHSNTLATRVAPFSDGDFLPSPYLGSPTTDQFAPGPDVSCTAHVNPTYGRILSCSNFSEVPVTVTIPHAAYQYGSNPISIYHQNYPHFWTDRRSGAQTTESFTFQPGEVIDYLYHAGAASFVQAVPLSYTQPSGATHMAVNLTYGVPLPLAESRVSTVCSSSPCTLNIDPALNDIWWQRTYLDASNNVIAQSNLERIPAQPAGSISAPPLIITTSPLPSATVNSAYTDTLIASGAGPITWSGTSGTLPPGLCLSVSTGVISGTPTTLGSFTVALTATNSFGSNTKTFTLAIGGGAPVITTTSPLPAANLNLAYSTTVAAAGAAPITWSLSGGSLPNGLTLNASTGVISGTPTVAATFSFTLTATNVVGSASSTFALTVNALPAITTASPLPAATVGIAYSTPLTATGTTPITWAVTVGSLPTGLALNASTGLVSGTPTVIGTSNFTITATNSVGNNAKAFTLTVNGVAPVITTASPLPAATQNTGYSTTLAATGSTPITWSVTVGTLPTGLSLAPSTGVISGTPTVIGTASFTMTATNTAGSNAKAFTLTVNGLAPVITTASPLPAATQNTNYSAPLTATGSTPITWTVTVGSLPAGLSLSVSSGVISGIPSGTGTSSFTVTATNAAGSNAKAFSLTVNGVQPTITTSSPLPGGTQNSAYSTTLAATGTTPITWALTVGSLPTGLSLNTSTGVISGTPTGTGTSNFTIQATNLAGANSKAFALTIAGIPPTITTSSPLPQGTQSTAYSTTLAATGTTPITWSLTVGTLPTGLSLNTSTGVISGTPSGSGTSSFTILATNSAGTFSQAFALTINSAAVAPTIATGSPLPQANQNVFYTAGLQATGTAPFTWSVTAGTLPAGLSLDPNLGLISGTPTTLGTSTFTVQALNSAGSNSKSFTLTIATGGTTMRGSVILSGSQKVH